MDYIIGLLMPMAIFLDPSSPVLLAKSSLAQGGVAFPLSFFVLPLALTISLFRIGGGINKRYAPLVFFGAPFLIYTILLSLVIGISGQAAALVYGAQWAFVFLWLPYFLALKREEQFSALYEGFLNGAFFSVLYYSVSGVLEIAIYGSLMDMGRMTQNLILPGQYQVAVYVPTLIAFSAGLINGLFLSGRVKKSMRWLLAFNFMTVLSLIFLAAREAILVYVLSLGLFYAVRKPSRFIVSIGLVVFLGGALFLNIDGIFAAMSGSEVRAFQKFASLQYEENRLGGRDVMIKNVLTIVESDPLFGSHFLPPDSVGRELGVYAPSAHNMYIDALVWTGGIGGALFWIFCASLFFYSLCIVLKNYRSPGVVGVSVYSSVLVLMLLIVSNNLNVPMRQPIVAPLFALLIVLIFKKEQVDK
ncbi:MAG: hypothetical protein H2067_11195 [Alcanivorax sp.]|nr:hypothetical protein [Alcanivorax sp.]